MINRLIRMNPKVRKFLWLMVIIGMISSIPLAIERVQMEQSSKKVELVLDYQDLIRVATFDPHPNSFLQDQYERLKAAGIHSMAVYESNLADFEAQRRIQLYTSYEASLLKETVQPVDENFTYLLFTDDRSKELIGPIIEREFERRNITVRPWTFQNQSGLVIEAAYHEAVMYPMDPDPLTIAELRENGFQIVVRLSDNRPLEMDEITAMLQRLSEQGVRWIIYAGNQVLGWEQGSTNREYLQTIAHAMNEYNIGFAIIELLNSPQQGVAPMAYYTDYNAVRLHSITEAETFQSSTRLADRILLAVKERDIRMVYLNLDVQRDSSKAVLKNSLENVLSSLEGENGAVARIAEAGFELGTAEPFQNTQIVLHRVWKLITVLGGIALTALMLGQFLPPFIVPIFMIGLLGSAGLYVLDATLLLQALALTTAISSPVLAAIVAMRRLQQVKDEKKASAKQMSRIEALANSLKMFVTITAISLIGAVYVVGLLNTIPYLLVIEQFRGVSLLHLAPIVLAGLYYVFYLDNHLTWDTYFNKLKSLFMSNIKLGYVILFGLFGVVIMYYLSRTGNSGQTTELEMMLRSTLEDVLGIRPRTKEFLIGHPLFIFGLYVAFRYRFGIFLFIPAVIGQLSMVDTFAHIHTPLWISAIRVLYGISFGIVIGIIGIAIWELAVRSWQKWITPRSAS